ncbi:MAG: hypothetical protein EBS55_14680 [Flavobacteriaceae bacterium]|nr:hypothetical protein [Flavobacteriaceae bacterium]
MSPFKKLIVRYKIYVRNLSANNEIRKIQRTRISQCTAICRKLIHNPESELLIAPISRKKYIKNEQFGIFITMEEGEITITNHTYSYFIKLPDLDWGKLKDFFKKEMEDRAKQMERDLDSQITHSLDTIFSKICN